MCSYLISLFLGEWLTNFSLENFGTHILTDLVILIYLEYQRCGGFFVTIVQHVRLHFFYHTMQITPAIKVDINNFFISLFQISSSFFKPSIDFPEPKDPLITTCLASEKRMFICCGVYKKYACFNCRL